MLKNVIAVVFFGAASVVSAYAQTTTATSTGSREYTFPIVGIGSLQNLQVIAVNTASASSTGTAASCTGSISFQNAAGTAVGTTTNFTLGTGQVSSPSISGPSAGASTTSALPGRAFVRAVVTLNTPTTTPRPPCALSLSLEIVDNAGNTQVVLNESASPLPAGRF